MIRDEAWKLYDEIVQEASTPVLTNPWTWTVERGFVFQPDYATLRRLLGVPLLLQAGSQSGVPALALDVWLSYEFRRAGFDPDLVWPRPERPRVLPAEIVRLLGALPGKLSSELRERINIGRSAGSANANILGKNYVKQVDVGISSWSTGPELLVSTKRMDSSFGKNAANRVEESYGDAKNLRLRHPQAAIGFLYVLSSDALKQRALSAWIVDLLGKLGKEDDAYHAVGLLIPHTGRDDSTREEPGVIDPDEPAPPTVAGIVPAEDDFEEPDFSMNSAVTDRMLAELPDVRLINGPVPAGLDPARFLKVLVMRVLDNSPVNFHEGARQRLADARSAAV